MLLDGDSQTIQLKTDPESLTFVERLVDEVRNKFNVSEDMYGNMLVAITEAVTNAIYHGNKSYTNKKISISFVHDPHSITFTIADEGKGFNYYELPDPTSSEKFRGRILSQDFPVK